MRSGSNSRRKNWRRKSKMKKSIDTEVLLTDSLGIRSRLVGPNRTSGRTTELCREYDGVGLEWSSAGRLRGDELNTDDTVNLSDEVQRILLPVQ